MKKDVPRQFLKQYEAQKKDFNFALEEITKILKLRLSQLSAQKGTRARLLDARVKRPGEIWKNATVKGVKRKMK